MLDVFGFDESAKFSGEMLRFLLTYMVFNDFIDDRSAVLGWDDACANGCDYVIFAFRLSEKHEGGLRGSVRLSEHRRGRLHQDVVFRQSSTLLSDVYVHDATIRRLQVGLASTGVLGRKV